MSRHGSYILSQRNYHNMAFLVVSQQRFAIGAWLRPRNFKSRHKNCNVTTGFHGVVSRQGILCRDKVLAKAKGSLIATKYFYVAI